MPQSQYDPGFAAFGGGATHTVLHPLVLVAMILVGALMFVQSRRYVMIPLFLGLMLIPSGQNIYIGGSHLYVSRILISFGLIRLIASKLLSSEDMLPGGFTTIDKLFVLWAGYRALAVTLVYMKWGAVPNQISFLWSALGAYFVFRWLIRDTDDVVRLLKVFAIISLFAAIGMVYEHLTGQNMLGFLGGIGPVAEIRIARIRAHSIFQHALLAGAYGASIFPLFIWLWLKKSRLLGMVGAVSASVIAFGASTSSGLTAWMAGIVALMFWPLRKWMRVVRWGIVAMLVSLQLAMKAPVWFILQHIDITGGSSGWERANLIDNFLKHFTGWWLIGTRDNVNWGWDMWDLANQFVAEGEVGGLICLLAFIGIIVICFRRIGQARKAIEGDKKQEWLYWLLAAALFAQIIAFFGIDYFDQTQFFWYALIVMIPVVCLNTGAVTALAPDPHPYRILLPSARRPATSAGAIQTFAGVSKRLSR